MQRFWYSSATSGPMEGLLLLHEAFAHCLEWRRWLRCLADAEQMAYRSAGQPDAR